MTQRRLAVLGSPIRHSLSPLLHRTAYAALGLSWQYDAIDIEAGDLAAFLDGLGPEWRGLSLTMPLKQVVLAGLSTRSDSVELAGAANTVLLSEGARHGENTDVPAMVDLIGDLAGAPVVLLGAGATARSALVALERSNAGSVLVASRRRDSDLAALAIRLGVQLHWFGFEDLAQLESPALVLSTLPGVDSGEVVPKEFQPPCRLFDVAYDPWPTPLADRFRSSGRQVITGLDLLLGQAARQVALFTERTPPIAAMRAALRPWLGSAPDSRS